MSMAMPSAEPLPVADADTRSDANAADRRALVFPGQGSQAVGMGRELAERYQVARRVFDEVDAALGQRLSTLMAEGPEAELTLT